MHRRRTHKLVAVVLVTTLSLAGIGGCPTAATVVGYTIAHQVFSFLLEETGKFLVSAGQTARKAGLVQLPFESKPTDTPASGTIGVNQGQVTALPLPGSAKPLTQQSINGSATVQIHISDAASTNPCEDGVDAGAFNITVTNGAVTVSNPTLSLPPAALAHVITGEFTVCFEVTSTVDVSLVIEEIIITFGAATTETPTEQPPTEQPPTETPTEQPPAGFRLATIAHSGTEELLVGPSDYIDPAVAFFLDHPFNVGGFALSGDGQKVWFLTYWHWSAGPDTPADWARVYSMNIDGSNVQQSDIPLDDAYPGWKSPFLGIATDDDGSDAIVELAVVYNPGTFSEYGASRFFHCTPGQTATLVYDTTNNPPEGSGGRGLRLNDSAGKFFWLTADSLWTLNLPASGAPSQICTVEHLNFHGPWDPVTGGEFNSFDIDAAGSTWMINVRFWDNDTQTSRWELVTGAGKLPENTPGIALAREGTLAPLFCMTDDAAAVAYQCTQGGNWCYAQGPSGTVDLTATGPAHTGATEGVRLSDNGKVAFFTYASDGAIDGTNWSSVLYDLEGKTRHLIGTGYFYGSTSGYQLSDDGSVLTGIFGCCRSEPLKHVWVCRDGAGARTGFPTIGQVAYRFDEAADALIVRVKAAGTYGLDRVTTYTHTNGVIPNGFYPADQSPLHGEHECFVAVEGETDTYERTIYLNGKKNLLDGSQFLRIVAVDGNKSRVTYQDFAPIP